MECSNSVFKTQQTDSTFVESADGMQPISTIDYSVNLMWVNRSYNPNQQYLCPAESEADLQTKLIKPVMEWAKATGSVGQVNLWYDSLLTPQQATLKTKEIFAREASLHEEVAPIHFKDVRELPEVNQHAEVFSDKTPVYFRADLLRVLAGYHMLTSNASHRFVYSDLDVKPLSKEELFDAKTQRKLYQFGIVMTRGGLGWDLQPYENMFQMLRGHKPNLLKSMKVAIIDISIERAKHILGGGYWAYKRAGDTQPLEQTVYDSYKNMFCYYYHLEGWGCGEFDETNMVHELGLQEIHSHKLGNKKEEISINKEKFSSYDGKIQKVKQVKVPTKIIVAPPSHFGISPIKKHDANKISPKNFKEKLLSSLEGNTLDSALLYLVARNNYLKEAQLIVDKLSPEALAEAVISPNSKFGRSDAPGNFPLFAAIEEGHLDFIRLVVERISSKQELREKIANVIAQTHVGFNKSILHVIAEKKNNLEVFFQFLVTSLASYPKMAETATWAFLEMEKVDEQLFRSVLDSAPDAIFESREEGDTLALKAAKKGHDQLLKIIAEKAPHTMAQKGSDGNFPLLYATNTDFATFIVLWQASPDMLTEKGACSRTVAHAAATYGQLQIIELM